MTSPPSDLQLRQAGNHAFSKKDFDTALSFYSQAIELAKVDGGASRVHVHYSNRALCYFVMEEYKKSMFDAMECIKNHPPMSLVDAKELIAKGENVVEKLDVDQVQRLKGFFRLGKAQLALKLYEDSFESLQEGCRISDEYINKVRNKLVVVEVRERSEICRVFAHS